MAPFDITNLTPLAGMTVPSGDRPASLLAVLRSAAVTEALDSAALRCITTDFSTLARLSDPSKGKRFRWSREKTEQQLAQLPADPWLLRPILERILPARLRIKPKRWSTIKSSVGRCLKLTRWIDDDDVLHTPLTAEWQDLCDKVRGGSVFVSIVRAFARFCVRTDIAPDAVTEETPELYRRWRQGRTLHLRISQSINLLRMVWNKMMRDDPDWPQHHLNPPPDPRRYVAVQQLPPSFISEVSDYERRLRNPDPLDPLFFKKLGDASICQRVRVLLRAGAFLSASGHAPERLADVVEPVAVRMFLMDLYRRLGKGSAWTSSSVYSIAALQDAARFVAVTDPTSLSEADLAQVEGFRRRVRVDSRKQTKKNRDRLAALDSPEMERRFLRLADECFARADELVAAGRPAAAAHLHKRALAVAILICKPLRRRNLAELDYHRHFHRDDRGRIVSLRIRAEEVHKSQVEIDVLLPSKLIGRIDKHWRIYRPHTGANEDSSALFANKVGKPLNPTTLAVSVMRLVENWIGIEFNMHLVRHWSACILFDDDPRNGVIVQNLLGHMDPASSAKYGARRTRAAHRLYAQILERRMAMRKRRSGR